MSRKSMVVDSNDGDGQNTKTISEERKPRCSSGHRGDTSEWREETVDETTLLFRDVCSWCFPDDDEPDIGDQVVRTRGQFSGGVIHLPGEIYAERHGEGDGDSE